MVPTSSSLAASSGQWGQAQAQSAVDVSLFDLRGAGCADVDRGSLFCFQGNGAHHMRGEPLADRRPARKVAVFAQAMTDRIQQVVGQHCDEQMRLDASALGVEHRPKSQFALQGAEGIFDAPECDVQLPQTFLIQVRSTGANVVSACIALIGLCGSAVVPTYLADGALIVDEGDLVVAMNAVRALLQPSQAFQH